MFYKLPESKTKINESVEETDSENSLATKENDNKLLNVSADKAYTPSSLSKFIGLCNYIKSSLLICDIHHNLESDIDDEVCKECENMLLKGPGSVY